ncbi:5286_t:CDS:2 [Funneliformis caledonium]|uniref:5286_t:CDS:1 n=1 Tax=Funneliformis caledonium TaxID=1117310 RepID=A0A9N9EVF5_9GLOM|nr:5286_t:CDS:2 [Funneliformis caledonium]
MTFNKNDINTIDEAKEYSNYYGGVLKPKEKAIFDSNLLKPNGTLDKALLQHTAKALFKYLLIEQRTNSIPYQMVNGIGSNKPIDKVVSQFEDIFFAKSEYEFDHKEEEVSIEILNLENKKEKKVKEIESLNQKNNHQKLLNEQIKLETNVATLVTALKNDLRTPGVGDRKFFDLIAENNKNTSNEIYTSTAPATAETYGSIIKTGYTKNSKPYTHPIYVTIDFQYQGYKQEDKETYRYISDIFYVMNKLFSQKDSNYKDNPFLKKGEKSCLQFNDTEKIYNNLEATDFSAYHEVLGSDAINMERIREEPITVYEKKIHGEELTR